MEEKIIVRYATPADEDRIVEIGRQQWTIINENYKACIGDDLFAAYFGTVENRVADKAAAITENARDLEHCVVTEVDGVVAGFAHFRTSENGGKLCGTLGHNAVDNNYKGRGIAGRQYAFIYDAMKKAGCVAVNVHTGLDEKHAPARRAYEKSGFSLNLPDINYYRTLKPGDELHTPKPCEDTVIVRDVKPSDKERVLEIAAQQWTIINNIYKNRIGDELYAIYYGVVEERVKNVVASVGSIFDTNPEYFVVTEVNGVVAGFATYRTVKLINGELGGVLGRNGVDNNYKGRGIAGRQYAALYKKMLEAGCTKAQVHTGLDDAHAPARRAYEKSGFEKFLPDINYYMML